MYSKIKSIIDKGENITTEFTENEIYPYAAMGDLKKEIIDRVRLMASNRQGREITGLSATRVKVIFKTLCEMGILAAHGSNRDRHYSLKQYNGN